MRIAEALEQGYKMLANVSDSARLDTELLLAASLRQKRSYLYAHPEYIMQALEIKTWQQLLRARCTSQPIAYLLGEKEFWSLTYKLSTYSLIPRPETEALIEYILTYYSPTTMLRVCDLGTGSGAIVISLAKHRPHWKFTAIDQHPAALAVAQYNAKLHQCSAIQFICSHWLQKLPLQQFDLIVANPPYIAIDDPHLQQGDVIHEPQMALISQKQGLSDLQYIIQQSPAHLSPGGRLILEHGYQQQNQVMILLKHAGFIQIQGLNDQHGLPRFCIGTKAITPIQSF